MLNRIKSQVSSASRRLFDQDQSSQIGALKSQIDRLEQIVYSLEESHYRSIGEPRPRRDKIFVGDMDNFIEVGQELFGHFKTIGELRPNERVLDIGCGIGRMAIPLTKYLVDGSYEGFDIVRAGIEWCNENISSRYPNFRFQFADIYNTLYNPSGVVPSKEYRFPYEASSFDFVFATSVFTHMLPEDMEHYLCETARVLKRGGRCLITFFLWNQEVERLIVSGQSKFGFKHNCGNYHVQDTKSPESAICYEEAFVLPLYEKYDLDANLAIHYGAWCGRNDFASGQDMIIATKA